MRGNSANHADYIVPKSCVFKNKTGCSIFILRYHKIGSILWYSLHSSFIVHRAQKLV
jgi:hypothetical protein